MQEVYLCLIAFKLQNRGGIMGFGGEFIIMINRYSHGSSVRQCDLLKMTTSHFCMEAAAMNSATQPKRLCHKFQLLAYDRV